MAGEIERQDAAHVDVVVSDWRKPAEHVVGMVARCQVDCRLEVVGVPRHDDIREQGEGTRDGAELFRRAAVFRRDHAVMDGALKAVDRLALIEQIEDFRPEHLVAEVIAEVEGAEQLSQCVTGFVDGIAGRCGQLLDAD